MTPLRAKAIVGCDILCRVLKKKLNFEMHQRMKSFKNIKTKEMKVEEVNDRNEIMSEKFSKNLLIKYFSLLLIGELVTP